MASGDGSRKVARPALAEAFVRIRADKKDIRRDMATLGSDPSVQSAGDNIGNTLGRRIGGSLKTALKGIVAGAVAGIGAAATVGIRTASQLEQTQIGFETM